MIVGIATIGETVTIVVTVIETTDETVIEMSAEGVIMMTLLCLCDQEYHHQVDRISIHLFIFSFDIIST